MKKLSFILIALTIFVKASLAQWTTAPGTNNIYNTNTGTVGIGIGAYSALTTLMVGGNGGNGMGNILTAVWPSVYANGGSTGLGYGLLSYSSQANHQAWSNIGLLQQTPNADDIAAGVHLAIYGWYQTSGVSLPISLGGSLTTMNPAIYITGGNVSGGATY